MKSFVWLKDTLLLTLFLSFFFGASLGLRPFASPDEGRYVEIPREMTVTGDYLTPHLNGLKYFEKPPLFYWLQAITIKCFGMTETTMRLWPVIFAILGCLMVYGAGCTFFDRITGLWGAGILATTFLYYVLARLIVLDMALAVFIEAALFCFWVGFYKPPGKCRRFLAWGCALSLGLAVMTKGLIALIIVGCVVGLWLLWTRGWAHLWPLYVPSAILVFLAVAAPWHIWVGLKNPEFFHFYFVHEHFLRYLTSIHSRVQPFWFFVPVVLLGTMPWTPFLFSSLRFKKSPELFLTLWVVFIFLFFSFSQSKLITYMSPLLPPLALLMAARLRRSEKNCWEISLYPLIFLGIVAAYALFGKHIPPTEIKFLGVHIESILTACCLIAALVPLAYQLFKTKGAIVVVLIFWMTLILPALERGSNALPRLSSQHAALAILEKMPQDTRIFMYKKYYQDIPVYMNKTVEIVDWQGELAFGHSQEPEKKVILSQDVFWDIWKKENPVCVVTNAEGAAELKAHQEFKGDLLAENPYVFCKKS